MAGISTLSGFNYNGGQYNFARDGYKTLQEMYDFPERYLPPMHIAVNEEDGNIWLFNSSNPITETGKWRIFTGGSADLIDYFKKNEIQAMLENYQLKEDGKGLSSNDYTTLEKEKLASLENYDDSAIVERVTNAENSITDIQSSIGNATLTTQAQTLTEALIEIKTNCDTANSQVMAKATANEDALAILNGDANTSGSVKKSVANTLKDAKAYTDQKIAEMASEQAIVCDEIPQYSNGITTYIKNGNVETTEEENIWFYYEADGKLMQTIFINGETLTIVSAGSVDFSDFVSKSKDIVSEYTGTEVDTTKLGNIAAMQDLENKLQTNIDDKISGDSIIDNLEDNSTNNALSSNQGRVLNEKINTKLDKSFSGEDVANKHLITDSMGNIKLGSYDETITSTSSNAVQAKALRTELDAKFNKVQDIANAGKVLSVMDDGSIGYTTATDLGGVAEKVSYENDLYFTDVTNLKQAIDKMCAKLYYEPLEITSFTCSANDVYEIGTVLDEGIEFSWSYNKDVTSQALTDCTVVSDDRSCTFEGSLSATKTFVLTASDSTTVKTASKKISFLPKIYYGCTNAEEINNSVILGLSDSVLASSPKRDYSFNCGSGEYAYIVLPTSQNFKGEIWVNGFQASMEKTNVISLSNESNYTQYYDIWRFTNHSLGSFVGTIK